MESVAELFAENFSARGEIGASVSAWRDGEEVISLHGGWQDRHHSVPWNSDTAILVWSAGKGPAAACVLHAMQQHGHHLGTRVAHVWPEFAQGGKGEVTLGQALSHQAGIPVLDRSASVFDYAAVVDAIAAQAPHWEPGSAQGYGPRVHSFVLDELVRRIAGVSLGEYWHATFSDPLGLDFWFGIPAAVEPRVAPVFPAKQAPPKEDPFYQAFSTPGSFTVRAFGSPSGLHSVAAMNAPEARRASFPGFGAIGTAVGLAKFYAMLACGGTLEGKSFLGPEALAWMETTLTQANDRVLLTDTAFSAGFMRDPVDASGHKTRAIFGSSLRAFGHPGAGGSHAFADPEKRFSFAYVMNQMEPGVLPGKKSLVLIEALEAAGR